MRDSHPGQRLPAVVNSFPVDESVYGVRGMAGGAVDWCRDVFSHEGPAGAAQRVAHLDERPAQDARRVVRGGSWCSYAHNCRAVVRFDSPPSYRSIDLSLRLARGLV